MAKDNKRIQESKRIIKLEKEKIKKEKQILKNKRKERFKKTKLGKFIYVFNNDKESYSFSFVLGITLVSLVIGAFACLSILSILTGGKNYFRSFKDLSKLYDAYETILDNYNGDIDKEEVVENAISSMVSSVGDVYTSYIDTKSSSEFDELVSGQYEGIGCVVQQQDDAIKIIEVYDGSPAKKAGLKAMDIIKSVDSKDALELGANKLSEYIKYDAKEKINMVIIRDEEEKEISLVRGKIEVPAISTEVFPQNNKKIGYLRISIFSSVAAKQFKNKLLELEKEKIDSLIIDVRDNNGGYLSTVSDIASYLLPKGKTIYQIQKDDENEKFKDKTKEKREYPIAILVNGNSASASEILAGVIKESYHGYVVGTTTYGKGTVQQVKKLSDGSMIKYTVENWLTPSGNWINNQGIEPTDYIDLDEKYFEDPTASNDSQLQKALEILSK